MQENIVDIMRNTDFCFSFLQAESYCGDWCLDHVVYMVILYKGIVQIFLCDIP